MASKAAKSKNVPEHSMGGSTPSKGLSGRTLSASALAVARLEAHKVAIREAEAEERATRRAVAVDAAQHVDAVAKAAEARGEEVAQRQPGERVVVLSRDGLEWMKRKGFLSSVQVLAGERFRADWMVAKKDPLGSCLANLDRVGGSVPGPRASFNDAKRLAGDAVERALRALGTPMLEVYVVGVAGKHLTLAQAVGCDVKRTDEHKLPCRIAFDLLARHYGMIGRG